MNYYYTTVSSPLDELTLVATDAGLCGLFFQDHKFWPATRSEWRSSKGEHFAEAKQWLEAYFEGDTPSNTPAMDFPAGTAFQHKVWAALQAIPNRETRTYSQISLAIGSPTAVRAVGTAIGKNPISIIVPCHRVVGSNGALTGFAGGVHRKKWLLTHEGSRQAEFYLQ